MLNEGSRFTLPLAGEVNRDQSDKRYTMPRARLQGFTLIELLVVVAIITVLIAMLLPALQSAREQSRSVVCISHMQNLGTAAMYYVNDYEGWLPPASLGRNMPQGWVFMLPYLQLPSYKPPHTLYDRAPGLTPEVIEASVLSCPSEKPSNNSGSIFSSLKWPDYGFNLLLAGEINNSLYPLSKLSHLSTAAESFYMADRRFSFTSVFYYWDVTFHPNDYFQDFPHHPPIAYRHMDKCTLLYADGHVSSHLIALPVGPGPLWYWPTTIYPH